MALTYVNEHYPIFDDPNEIERNKDTTLTLSP